MKLLCQTILMCAIAALLANGLTLAATDTEEKLDDQQKKLQAEIEHSLVAPCCWNMTVDQHDSPAATQVRAKITDLILAGKSKSEILKYFSSQPQYGERILATPSQENWLGRSAYWLIPVVILLGAGVVMIAIKKLARPEEEAQQVTAETSKEPADTSQWASRVEKELKDLDS